MSTNQKQGQYLMKQVIRTSEPGPSPPQYQAPPQPHTNVNSIKQLTASVINREGNKQFYPTKPTGDTNKQFVQGFPKVPNLKPYIPPLQTYPSGIGQPSGYPNASQIPIRNFQQLSDEHLNKISGQLNFLENETRSQVQATAQTHQTHRPRSADDDLFHFIPQSQPRRNRPSDEELLRQSPAEMLKFVKRLEGETARITSEQSRQIQNIINELKLLKDANQRLNEDNQELRDLCCFLDDDRQKGRKLAREWQRFGRYTASVMRQEVSAYQSKLRELDNKQQELIKDNLELKELCLYLDEERSGNNICPSCGVNNRNLRDDGDGSSSSTNADEHQVNDHAPGPRRSASRERILTDGLTRQRSMFNDQTMQYVKNLEQKIKQLEEDKRVLQSKNSQVPPVSGAADPNAESNTLLSGRPEAVVRALQVLEVREQLERDGRAAVEANVSRAGGILEDNMSADMDDGEKALVREMCNVVWRKLEENPPEGRR